MNSSAGHAAFRAAQAIYDQMADDFDEGDPLMVAFDELQQDASRARKLAEDGKWERVESLCDEMQKTAKHIAEQAQLRIE